MAVVVCVSGVSSLSFPYSHGLVLASSVATASPSVCSQSAMGRGNFCLGVEGSNRDVLRTRLSRDSAGIRHVMRTGYVSWLDIGPFQEKWL